MIRPTRIATPLLVALGATRGAPLLGQVDLPPEAVEEAPLFASQEVLEFTLVADFELLEDDRGDETPERPAVLLWSDSAGEDTVEIPLQVRTRGGFRLRPGTCSFPNLRLDFDRTPAAVGTPFAGQNAVKLVAHCRDTDVYEQNMLVEYAAYRLYNLLSDVSFRVRLARITYRDHNGRTKPLTRHAFLIENVNQLAARFGGISLEVRGADPLLLDPAASTRVELFQYMIGNTDFSVVNFHNAELIRMPDGSYHPVPYDFDFSGLVDAPYAAPSAIFDTRSVRERIYRGFCRPGLDMDALFTEFLARRRAFERVFRDLPQLDRRHADRAVGYLEEFFDILDSPSARRSRIERRCRTAVD